MGKKSERHRTRPVGNGQEECLASHLHQLERVVRHEVAGNGHLSEADNVPQLVAEESLCLHQPHAEVDVSRQTLQQIFVKKNKIRENAHPRERRCETVRCEARGGYERVDESG